MLKLHVVVTPLSRSQRSVICGVLLVVLGGCVPVGASSQAGANAQPPAGTFTPGARPAATETAVPPRVPAATTNTPARRVTTAPAVTATSLRPPRERAQSVPSETPVLGALPAATDLPPPSAQPPVATATPPPPTDTSAPPTQPPPPAGHPYDRPLVIANYFPWYDQNTWSRGCTSAGDTPSDGVYNSDDDGVIQRQIAQAQSAGIDGFAVHFYAPGNRTDVNFQKVLAYSGGNFHSAVTFLTHILPGATLGGVQDSLAYVIGLSGSGSYLRYNGKPVILFADMGRIPDDAGGRVSDDGVALERWRAVRNAVDPDHATIWIAEGLNPVYLDVFDGLYVYKIDHSCCAGAYNSAPRWAGWVRSAEQSSGQAKYWVGTVMPGWNDLNSANPGCEDLRVSSAPFARDRADGAYYAATWNAVLPTNPDFVVVHSFNEWVEGSYLEPSAFYGDRYLGLTAQWAATFHGSR
jgi:hypothetical protein